MRRLTLTLFALSLLQLPARGAEMFLAVGPGGQRMLSEDGTTWKHHVSWAPPSHDQNDLNVAVFFRGAAYVGGGYSIARMTATRDGKSWSEGVLPNGSPVFGLEVLDDALYVVCLRGQVFRTRDGERYELVGRAEMPGPTHWIRGTASGNGLIVGSGDFGPAMAYDPRTGRITVTQLAGQTEKQAGLKRVAFGNGRFVVGGQDGLLASSADGVHWRNNEVHPERGHITSVVWTGREFLASTSKRTALVSPDGGEWTRHDSETPRSIVRAGGRLFGWAFPPSKIRWSADGRRWEAVPNEREFLVKHVAFGALGGHPDPPRLPPGRVPPAGMNRKPNP